MDADLETELVGLLREVSGVQDELLAFLAEKGRLLAAVDVARLSSLEDRERELCQQLQQCHEHRSRLLARAAEQGLPAQSLRALAAAAPRNERSSSPREPSGVRPSGVRLGSPDLLAGELRHTTARARLLQHHNLSNWLIIQRTLLHLSQLLEIIGTGGRLSPTYGRGKSPAASGALVDRAV